MHEGRRESLQPIVVRPPSESRPLFAIRCVVDLQLLTIVRFLRPRLRCWQGRVLDVGAGESPWRELMPDVEYVGVDTYDASDYGMSPRADLVRYDGRRLPFDDASFDHVLCVEVLEHVSEPLPFLIELRRVLKPSGTLVLTVPWSARVHHVPNDYHRFTRFGLKTDLALAGFGDVSVEERGNDIAAIANKLIVVVVQLVRPRRRIVALLTWPVAALLSPLVALSLVAAHMTLVARWGSRDDPLGYGVSAA